MTMTCWETVQAYAFRSIGYGENLLPKTDFTLCQHFTLIGSGMIWNVYFGALALGLGFFFANALALAKAAQNPWLRKPADWFIFVFRGSPLFIQFFIAYEMLVLLPRTGIDVFGITVQTGWLTKAWAGALLVLFLNTAAYSAEIFYGALRSIPKGDLEAADAYGISGWQKFRRIQWPTMLRLGWPAYTNEAISCFTPPRWCSLPASPRSGRWVMRFTTPTISPTKPSTPSSPTPSSASISSCSRWWSFGALVGSTAGSTGICRKTNGSETACA